MMRNFKIALAIICIAMISGCEPEVGSKKWCEKLEKKDKGEWTLNEGKDYIKHCVIPKDKEE